MRVPTTTVVTARLAIGPLAAAVTGVVDVLVAVVLLVVFAQPPSDVRTAFVRPPR